MGIYQNIFRRGWVGWLLSMLVCMMMVYGVSGIIYFTLQITGPTHPLSRIFAAVLISNFCNAVTTLLVCFSFNWIGYRWSRAWVRHAVLSLLLLVTVVGANGLLWSVWLADMVRSVEASKDSTMKGSLLYMLVPVLVGNLFYYFQQKARTVSHKITQQEYQLLQLEQQKTRAELEALQAKINPHFLYNALNSSASLVHDDPDRAEQMVLLLSKMFRYTTSLKNDYFSTVATELEMVQTYLDVEQVRFGDRLTYRIDLAQPELNRLSIPQFLLQPLVENAIKHGISRITGPGGIVIRIHQDGDWLFFQVHDNGPAFPEELTAGYGLQSIQDKLRLLYGDDARLLVQNKPLKEIIVQIRAHRLTPPAPSAGARPSTLQPSTPSIPTT